MKAKKLLVGFAALTFTTLVLSACSPDSNTAESSSSVAASSEVVESSSTAAETEEEAAAPAVTLQEGTYTLEEKNYSNGYRVVFSIVVKDGKVAESNYDNINEAGESKVDDADYNAMMLEKAGIAPETFIPELNKRLVEKMATEEGVPSDIDVVTGATSSFNTFVIYAEQLINAAQNGNTETITVDNPTQ